MLTITDAFAGGFDPGVHAGPINIKLSGLQNPRSLAPTSSFTIDTQDNGSNAIDKFSTTLTVTMTTINDLKEVLITPASKVNGALNIYDISFKVNSPL